MENPWKGDRLGYEKIGASFTNLIKSIDTGKVVSIEAGFGRGKTFFREAWSEELRRAGELVVEIDVRQSDHSGDPIVTLLGALVEKLPREEGDTGAKVLASAKRLTAIGLRTVAKATLKSAADELIEYATESAIDQMGDFDALDKVVTELGDGMSKAAGQLIASQLAVERVRKQELPKQLKALHSALAKNVSANRVVVVIDELDRCHPEYAISFLEAMKLIFSQSGFVFCLMVNADYLEKLAQHRFGASTNDEKYLDKFVDIRLKLDANEETFKSAVAGFASELPLKIPYADHESFSLEHAAKLAGELAVARGVSLRKAKRILLKVEVALRCYADLPLDASLLIYLAFRDDVGGVGSSLFPRAIFTPEEGQKRVAETRREDASFSIREEDRLHSSLNNSVYENAPELLELPIERYRLPDNRNYHPWALVYQFLTPHYFPSHEDVLNSVASIVSDD